MTNKNVIKVLWEDTVSNYTIEKEREIKRYFREKYDTERVNVIFKAITNTATGIDVGDVSGDLIIDINYQRKLMQEFAKQKELDANWRYLFRLDDKVNSLIENSDVQNQRFKQIVIKKLEFSNFLSFGPEKHVWDLTQTNGVIAVASTPPNFGGKTVLTVDLLLFLFFNDTTRTTKSEEIFNKFSNYNKVSVKGEVNIDNKNYIIERTLTRRQVKTTGEWKVSTSLDFYEILEDDKIIKLNGEQRQETDQIIKNYIGTKEDFLLTIVTTAGNLEDLIATKPTERGHILTRFIGIDFFREKEKKAKEEYNTWKLGSKSAHYTVEGINSHNKELQEELDNLEKQIITTEIELNEVNGDLDKKNEEKANALRKIQTVDQELYKMNEAQVVNDLNMLQGRITQREAAIKEEKAKLKQPETAFDVDEFNALNSELSDCQIKTSQLTTDITKLSSVMSDLSNTITCTMCDKVIFNDQVSEQIKANKIKTEELQLEVTKNNKKAAEVSEKIKSITTIKDEWAVYDKAVLSVDRSELDLQKLVDSKTRGDLRLKQYRLNKQIIENNKIIETDIARLDLQIRNLIERKDSIVLMIGSWKSDAANMENKIQENNDILDQLQKEEAIDLAFRTYIEMFGKNGIGKMVLATMIPLINSYLTQILSDVSEFMLELTLNEKNMVEFNMIDKNDGIARPLYAGSGFEKTVASIALRCVLSKICSLPKPNIIVFDEVFGAISNDNLEKLSYLFDRLKEFFETIVLISHNPMVHEWGDTKLIVVKENRMSKLKLHE